MSKISNRIWKKDHLEFDEHNKKKKLWYFEVCEQNFNKNSKASFIEPTVHVKKNVDFWKPIKNKCLMVQTITN